jgi:hypothetical protein
MAKYQELILQAGTTSGTMTGKAGPITISDSAGAFAGATLTQTMPDDSVAIDTWTAEDSFYFNGSDVAFGLSTVTTEVISIKWYPNRGTH